MQKRFIWHIVYWTLVLLFLTLFFGQYWESYILAFYFSSLLLPIVIGTTYFFNMYLVPEYFFTGRYMTLSLYTFYMLVVSLCLEMLVVLFSFAVIANYKLVTMSTVSTSIFVLGITLYLIVFVTSFIRLVFHVRKKNKLIESLEIERMKNEKTSITVRAARKNIKILFDDLLYLESMNDYVKLVTVTDDLITREKITKLQLDLPDRFVRVHRSFIINKEKVSSFTRKHVTIDNTSLPVGRNYKETAMDQLRS